MRETGNWTEPETETETETQKQGKKKAIHLSRV